MADEERITTWVKTPVRKRLDIYAALTGSTVKDIVDAILDKVLPSASELARLCESEATS